MPLSHEHPRRCQKVALQWRTKIYGLAASESKRCTVFTANPASINLQLAILRPRQHNAAD